MSALVPPNPTPPAAADDRPEFATREEAAAFWQGVKRGIRDSGEKTPRDSV